MNDRHPSGTATPPAQASDAASAHYASYGTQEAQYGDFTTFGDYDATGFDGTGFPGTAGPATGPPAAGLPPQGFDATGVGTGTHVTAAFDTDPLFGSLPGAGDIPCDATGSYDAQAWSTGSHQTLNYDMYAAQHHAAAYDTGAYDTTAWSGEYQQLTAIPPQTTGNDTSGQWDANAWLQPHASPVPADQAQHWEWGTQAFDTGAYDATQWNGDGGTDPAATPNVTEGYEPPAESLDQQETAFDQQVPLFDQPPTAMSDQQATAAFEQTATAAFDQVAYAEPAADDGESAATGELPAPPTASDVPLLLDGQEEVTPATVPSSRAAARNGSRSRRRPAAKRSALFSVAVPSACVMGVAGIAAASVGTMGEDTKEASTTAADASAVKPSAANNKLDSQLEGLSAEADDFSDRVSRTQERIDLKEQQAAEKKEAAAEAARKERLRPKYSMPVAQHGLSAYYGQSGVNWMSVHTGIDFPVSYGTTVMAATDGTVRTQWNSAYGNMMIVTAKDGTETWYCHLSSYRVASGTTVKAGDPIAYSGNSGNSTGPHLHFEVRPSGGSAIDPLPWLRSHGIDPT